MLVIKSSALLISVKQLANKVCKSVTLPLAENPLCEFRAQPNFTFMHLNDLACNCVAELQRNELFWVVRQGVVVILTDVSQDSNYVSPPTYILNLF